MSLSRLRPVLMTAVFCLALCACGGNRLNGEATGAPAPLPAAPSRPVQMSELPPPQDEAIGPDGAPVDPAATGAAASDGPPNADLSRESLLGSWRLTSGAENCSLNLTLTGWTGGYRANTRGCQTPELKDVNAWSFEGEGRVVLRDAAGSPLINLAAQSGANMSGSTNAGISVAAIR